MLIACVYFSGSWACFNLLAPQTDCVLLENKECVPPQGPERSSVNTSGSTRDTVSQGHIHVVCSIYHVLCRNPLWSQEDHQERQEQGLCRVSPYNWSKKYISESFLMIRKT